MSLIDLGLLGPTVAAAIDANVAAALLRFFFPLPTLGAVVFCAG
jgi:hypothetical protein